MYTARLAKLTLVLTIVSALVGCTPLFKSPNVIPARETSKIAILGIANEGSKQLFVAF